MPAAERRKKYGLRCSPRYTVLQKAITDKISTATPCQSIDQCGFDHSASRFCFLHAGYSCFAPVHIGTHIAVVLKSVIKTSSLALSVSDGLMWHFTISVLCDRPAPAPCRGRLEPLHNPNRCLGIEPDQGLKRGVHAQIIRQQRARVCYGLCRRLILPFGMATRRSLPCTLRSAVHGRSPRNQVCSTFLGFRSERYIAFPCKISGRQLRNRNGHLKPQSCFPLQQAVFNSRGLIVQSGRNR